MKIGRATIHNIDCMEFMKGCEDNQFDLAIVDPPYGISDKVISGGENGRKVKVMEMKKWDVVPSKEYFRQLFRVSKNQIIWGANYYPENLFHSRGWIIWDKVQPANFTMAKAEIAFTSFNVNSNIFRYFAALNKNKIHPTQKPIELYEWLLTNYAKQGDTILDTHGGSLSIAIATNKLGFDLTACELDKDYYQAACERVKNASKQVDCFTPPIEQPEQQELLK